MDLERRIKAFSELGNWFRQLAQPNLPEMEELALLVANENPWFTRPVVQQAIDAWASVLTHSALTSWTLNLVPVQPRTVGLVLAGNIPMVGFHDILASLICGHKVQIKASHKDSVLLRQVLKQLTQIEPEFIPCIQVVEQLKGFDAIIATGSDNSARYFELYFGKYPHLIRKNRTSLAILQGNESPEELANLGRDVFDYFGLGCRNVSRLLVPEDYDFTPLLQSWERYQPIINHHKYANNYDYQKSILLINKIPFLDTGFVLLTPSDRPVSPISVVFYQYYTPSTLPEILANLEDKTQCIVGYGYLPFGTTQVPALDDYADKINTLDFLTQL